ncbi:ferrochelatase [Vampirovibrio sp.]|uniref:ferrochelatase n=1 Tax=Vampirovibrio sp. TaxID=2717857 RepID=UPI0035943D50
MPSSKTGILFLNLGGPDNLESVKPFLFNLFADPDIIKLPLSFIFQKPLAWLISTKREELAQENYALMGGGSPILPFTIAQGEALKQALMQRGQPEMPIYIAMRYWHPFTEEAVDQIVKDGIQRLIVVPLYPHFSYTTTGSSLNELKRVLDAKGVQLDISVVPPYHDHPTYLQAMQECIEEGLNAHPWTCPKNEVQLLFSAHSLPIRHVKRTKDPYPEQIYSCAETIATRFFPHNPWELAYQSQVGKMPWLGPATEGVLPYFAANNRDNILMVALSFVSDHVETLVEIDQEYIPLARELGIQHCYRAPSLNTNASFIQALAELTLVQLEAQENPFPFSSFPELLKAQASA